MKKWKIINASVGSPECEKLLDDGWEPFSVVLVSMNQPLNPNQIVQIPQVFLRKSDNDAAPLRAV